jgi:hypothetical protein
MQQALGLAPQSLDDLVALSGLSKRIVTRYVRELYEGGVKMVHVGDWDRDRRGYPTIRKFKWGNEQDVACPLTTRTAAERMRDVRAKRKEGAS